MAEQMNIYQKLARIRKQVEVIHTVDDGEIDDSRLPF